MAKIYNQINKVKDKYQNEIDTLNKQILELKNKIADLEKKNQDLREERYKAGEGKGERNRLENIIVSQEREKKTLQNKLRDLDGSKLISSFSPERQELIRRIRSLSFNNHIYNSLLLKFKDGLNNVIEIAYRIKNKQIVDIDYYTFVFRDDIVGLLEKMLRVLTNKNERSATEYIVKLRNNEIALPNKYYKRIPNLKDKDVMTNVLYLINLQSAGYHGTHIKYERMMFDKETDGFSKPERFLELDINSQLTAIFTLLEFMYEVFSNEDREDNLLFISNNWFLTAN